MLALFSMAGRLCWKTREIWIGHTMKSRSRGVFSDFWELNAKCEIVGSFLAVVLQWKSPLLQKIIGSNRRLKKSKMIK